MDVAYFTSEQLSLGRSIAPRGSFRSKTKVNWLLHPVRNKRFFDPETSNLLKNVRFWCFIVKIICTYRIFFVSLQKINEV
jgi:hypothetical protein